MTASNRAREQYIRQVCEDLPGTFTWKDVMSHLQDRGQYRKHIRVEYSWQEVVSIMGRLDDLRCVGTRDGRKLYVYSRRRRIPDDPIGYALGRRECGRCGGDIEPGDVILNLSNKFGKPCRGLCKQCAVAALLEWLEQLQD